MTINPDEGDVLLRIRGVVPAIDFQPFVVRVARRLRIRGWVRHEADGALIRAVGAEEPLAALVRALWDGAPASARIRGIETENVTAETPEAAERFAVLPPSGTDWHAPSPRHPPPLARVA